MYARICTLSFIIILTFFRISVSQENQSEFKVKYLSAQNVYLDAGAAQGLNAGDRLKIERGKKVIAEVEIVYVAENSSSCKIIKLVDTINTGDRAVLIREKSTVEKIPSEKIPAKATSDSITASTQYRSQPVGKKLKIYGSIALQYYYWNDISAANLNYSQPTLRLNLKLSRLWDKDYHIRIRTRTRYNQRSRAYNQNAPKTDWKNRIYEFSFTFDSPESWLNYRFGRIISNQFSGIGYIDGVLLQQNLTQSVKTGIFAGTQPEWQYANFQTSIQKYGGYVTYTQGDFSKNRYESTLAFAGEYHGSTVSREYIYLQNNIALGRAISLFQSSEVDINRSWRKQRTGEGISLTNFYLSSRWYVNDWMTIGAMYDNRRNYWTYETRGIADSLFNEAMRYGLRGSLDFKLPLDYRIFTNFGFRKRKTDSEYTYSYTLGLSKFNFLLNRTSLYVNAGGFSNIYTDGYNYSLRIGKSFFENYNVDISGGGYLYSLDTDKTNRQNQWIQINLLTNILQHLYASSQYEYDWGDDIQGNRLLFEIGYRF